MIEIGDFPQYHTQQGWVCPKCGRVYAPLTPMCWYCGKGAVTNTVTSSTNLTEYLKNITASISDVPSTTYDGEWFINALIQGD